MLNVAKLESTKENNDNKGIQIENIYNQPT